jgi:hypothetical protein
MEKVVAINNYCIETLSDGNISHALSELTVAMRFIKQFIDPIQPGPQTDAGELLPEPSSSFQDPPRHCPHQKASSITVSIASATSFLSSSASPTPIVRCQHPLLLKVSHKSNVNGPDFTDHVHVVCAALLYNTALLCHEYAICSRTRGPREANHIRASKTYELLIAFCNQSAMVNTMHRDFSSITMIQMMAYNNYGDVCYESENYVKYMHCMNGVQTQLLLSQQSSISSADFNTPNDTRAVIYNELQLNVLVARIFPNITTAPSA